jgi:hypothetical protein
MKLRVSIGLPTGRWLAQCMSIILALPPGLIAQQPPDPNRPMAPLPTVQGLKVMALAGNGEQNDLERRIMAPLVVQVLDQNSRPVEGASVVFRFPLTGPSASFPNGEKSKTSKTNADGQAAAIGWMANGGVGTFQVHVTASRGNEIGEAVISMSNVTRVVDEVKSKHKSAWSSRWVKLAIVAGAAGAVAGIVLATRGGGGSTGTQTTTVTASPGSPTIGGPH